MSTKLTDPQIRILRAIRARGNAYIPGMNGGGRDQCVAALFRKELIVWADRKPKLTEAGDEALDAVEAAEQARLLPVRKVTHEERTQRRVASAAARFLAETRGTSAEPTDENLAAAFANVVRPLDRDLYPRVRARVNEIRAEREAAEGKR